MHFSNLLTTLKSMSLSTGDIPAKDAFAQLVFILTQLKSLVVKTLSIITEIAEVFCQIF